MSRKKVLHLLSSGNYSGAEKVAVDIILNNRKDYDSFYVSPNGIIIQILNNENIQFYELKSFSLAHIRKAFVEIKPDIVQAHDFRASIFSALLKDGFKLVSHIHQNPSWFKNLNPLSLLFLIFSVRFDKIIFVSNWIYEIKYYCKLFNNKVSVVYNYVNYENLLLSSNTSNQVDCQDNDVLFVGRLEDVKNPLRFIELIFLLKNTFPSITAGIVGGGNLKELCVKKVIHLGLENNVRLYDYQQNPYQFVKRAKIIVMPSKWEGFGLVAVEAILLKKFVVASNVGGLKDILCHDRRYLCTSNHEFINAISLILKGVFIFERDMAVIYKNVDKYTQKKIWVEKLIKVWETDK